jgi:hypothetical protein
MCPVIGFEFDNHIAQRRLVNSRAGNRIEVKIFIQTHRTALRQLSEWTDFSAASPTETIDKAKTYLLPALGAEMFIVFGNGLITASAVILPEKLLYIS